MPVLTTRRFRLAVLLSVVAMITFAASPVLAQATVGFSKAFSPDEIGLGSASTLVFTLTNGLATPVEDLAFTDTLPAGVTITTPTLATTTCAGATLSAPAGGGTITFSDGALGAGGTCRVRVNVTSSTPGVFMNTSGPLTYTVGGVPGASPDTATDDLTVATNRPGFTKSFADATIPLGGRTTLTFVVDNSTNASTAFNLTFADTLPTGLRVAGPANVVNDCGGTLSAPPGGSTIELDPFTTSASVASGAICTISVDVVATGIGSLVNLSGNLTSIDISSTLRNSGKAIAGVTVTRDDLHLQKSFTNDPVPPGGVVNLRFTITNFDRSDAVTGITFTDDLDATLSGLAAIGLPLADVCGPGSQISGTSLLTLTGGSLGPGESCTFSVPLQVPAGAAAGVYPNTTSTISGDRGGSPVSGGAAEDPLFVQPAPALTKTLVPDVAAAGDTVDIEFTITNTDDSSPVSDVSFTDNLSDFLAGVTVTTLPANGFCGPGSTASAGGDPLILTVSGANLAAGDSCTFTVTVMLPASVGGNVYTNVTSEIAGTVGGVTYFGSPASDDLAVLSAPALDKEFVDDPVTPGSTVDLTFTLTHDDLAPDTATGINFTDDLSAALSGLTAIGLPMNDVCGAGSQISGTSLLSFSGGTLAPGESCSFTVTLQVPAGALPGLYVNTTSPVDATVLGTMVSSNPAVDTLFVTGLELTKEFTDDPVIPGAQVTLEFTLANPSASTITGITFTDQVDQSLPGLTSITPLQSDICGMGSLLFGTTDLTFFGGSLAPGGSCTFQVTLQVPAGAAPGLYPNATSPVDAQADGTPITVPGGEDDLLVIDALSISKEFVDDPAVAGGTTTLELTLTNLLATDTITGIEFTDDLDAALSGLQATDTPQVNVCGAGSQISGTSTLSFTGGTLAPGASCTFQVTLQVPASAPPGTMALNTTSSVNGTAGATPVSGAPASDTLLIDFFAFSKSFDGPTTAGGTPTLTFTIENLDASNPASGLEFSDDLDAALAGLVATGLPTSDVCGAGSQIAGTSFLTFTGGSLGPGESCSFSVDLLVPAGAAPGDYLNTTSELRQSGLPVSEPASDTLSVEPPPTFAKSFNPDSIGSGQTSTLSFVIDNSASAVDANALDFTDNLPAGVVVASPANASTTCTGGTISATPGGGTISYSGGSVAAGSSCIVQIDVTGTTPGVWDNVAGPLTSSSGDSGTASDTLTVNPQPGFAKQFTPGAIPVGGVSVLTFTIDNSASTVDATNLSFTDDLPGPVVVASPANASTTCTGGTLSATPGSGTISYSGGSVAAGASCVVQVDVTSALAGSFDNVSGPLTSSLGSSGTASDTLIVEDSFLAISKGFLSAPVLRGGQVDLEFTITNLSSNQSVSEIAFTDDLGASVPGMVALGLPQNDVCGPGSQLTGTNTIALDGGSLAPGASCTFSVPIQVPADAPLGVFTNTTSQVTGSVAGIPVTGNSASDDLTIVFLEFSKVFDDGFAQAGSTTPLTFTIVNPDPANAATDISFSDDLDAALAGLMAVGLPQNDVCGAGSTLSGDSLITLTGGALGALDSCTFTVLVEVPQTAPDGTITNVTSPLAAMVSGMAVMGDAAGAATAQLAIGATLVAIPTLGSWGLALLAVLLLAPGMILLRRRRAEQAVERRRDRR